MENPIVSSLVSIIAYAPVVLYTESLRVQHAMAVSILRPCSVAPAITGCVKDLHRLWYLDDTQLLGNFEDERAACAVSVKHGSSFTLQNQTVLQLAGMLRGKMMGESRAITPYQPSVGEGFQTRRETIVSLNFVLPHESGSGRRGFSWLQGVCWGLTALEFVCPIVLAAYMALRSDIAGVVLMMCISLSVLILAILHYLTHPLISNQSEISKVCKNPIQGASTLDVHVIADHWNDKHLNVVCGYTSHLHALTNIPMAVSRPGLFLWASRSLAAVLFAQAASLASLVGNSENAWLSLSWLSVYLLMMLPPWILKAYRSELDYKCHTASLTKIPPIRFSGRRAALVFISRLPSSKQAHVDSWTWANVFTPDNERRRIWQAHVDSLDLVSFKRNPDIDQQDSSEELNAEYLKCKDWLKEASAAYHHPEVLPSLLSYNKSVGLKKA